MPTVNIDIGQLGREAFGDERVGNQLVRYRVASRDTQNRRYVIHWQLAAMETLDLPFVVPLALPFRAR